jgi:hypothetical protein
MSHASAAKRVERFPWEPESLNRATLAATALRVLIQQRSPDKTPQGLLVAAGAMAGFAAQNAALEQGELLTTRRDLVAPESLMLRLTPEGTRYLAGRWINAPLLLGYGHGFPLQRFVIKAAATAGLNRAQFDDYWELERRIGKAAKEGDIGWMEAENEGEPAPPRPQDLLKGLWPTARRLMVAPMPLEMADEPPLNEAHWPILMGQVAGRLMGTYAEKVAPKRSATLVMEAALVASKLDPDLVDPGRWSLAPGPRGLQIMRDDRKRMARRIA